MRVALFHNLPPGGARRAMYEIFRRLDHEIHLYTLDLGRAERWPDLRGQYDLGGYVHHLEIVPLHVPPLGYKLERVWAAEASVRAQAALAERIDRAHYDLVIVQHDQFTSTPSLLKYLRTPSIYVCHEPRRSSFEELARPQHPSGLAGIAARSYEASIFRRDQTWIKHASAIVANSSFSAEAILRAYGRSALVSHLGVDTDIFHPGDLPRNGVVTVGALDRLKGQIELVEAIGRIAPERRPPLTVVHERRHEAYARQVVEAAGRLGVELRFRRNLSEAELVDAYRSASVTACVAFLEPFGLTALESMACGTPVVAVREGGFRESVTGDAGYLVDRHARAIATAIDDVVNGGARYSPADVRATVVPYWTWDKAAQRFDDAMRSTIEELHC